MSESADIPEGYKATELGVIPEEWDICPLNHNEFFEYENGIWKGTKGELVDCNILRNTNFRNDGTLNYSDVATIPIEKRHIIKKRLKFGDIIIERSGGGPTQPVGRVVFFERGNETFCFSNFTSRLRVTDQKKVDPRFLHQYLFYFHSIGKTNELQQRTTGIRNLMFEDYKKTVIPLPPLTEQHAISTTLRTVQEAKEKTDAVIAATKSLKAAMMRHLFTYGPVPPEEAERVALKETEIGQVPEEWKLVIAKDQAELITKGSSPKWQGFDYCENGVTFVRSQNIGWGTLELNDVAHLPQKFNEKEKKSIIKKNDVLINLVGASIGRVALADETIAGGNLNQAVGILRLKQTFSPKFIMYYLLSESGQQQIYRQIKEIARANISLQDIQIFILPCPSIPIQQEITSIITSLDQKLAAEQSHKEALDTLFTSLLHDLMTAKIRVGYEGTPATKTSV